MSEQQPRPIVRVTIGAARGGLSLRSATSPRVIAVCALVAAVVAVWGFAFVNQPRSNPQAAAPTTQSPSPAAQSPAATPVSTPSPSSPSAAATQPPSSGYQGPQAPA